MESKEWWYGGRTIDGYHIDEAFTKCWIAWLLITIMLPSFSFQTSLCHNLRWNPTDDGGRVIDKYHIKEEFTKCWIACLLISIVLLPLSFQTLSTTICDGVEVMMVVEWLMGIILKKNSPSVGLLGYWWLSCFYPFLFRHSLPQFLMDSNEWWWSSDWWVSYSRRIC